MTGGRRASVIARSDSPWLLVEFVMIASMMRDGAMVFDIARALRRPVPQIRAVLFGADA